MVHARKQLADTDRLSERVDEVADHLSRIARRNHIAESIIQAIRGGA